MRKEKTKWRKTGKKKEGDDEKTTTKKTFKRKR